MAQQQEVEAPVLREWDVSALVDVYAVVRGVKAKTKRDAENKVYELFGRITLENGRCLTQPSVDDYTIEYTSVDFDSEVEATLLPSSIESDLIAADNYIGLAKIISEKTKMKTIIFKWPTYYKLYTISPISGQENEVSRGDTLEELFDAFTSGWVKLHGSY